MRYSPIQTSFAGGEIDPRLHGRVDSKLYGTALEYCRNFEPQPQGPLLMRRGTGKKRNLTTDGAGLEARGIGLRTSSGENVLAVLSHYELRLYDKGGSPVLVTLPGGGEELLVNGTFADGQPPWIVSGTPAGITFENGKANFSAEYGAGLNQTVEVEEATDAVLSLDLEAVSGNSFAVLLIQGTRIWQSGPWSGEVHYSLHSETGALEWAVHLEPGTYQVWCWCLLGGAAVVDNVSLRAVAGGGSAYVVDTPWSADQVAELQHAPESAASREYFAHPNVRPYYLQRQADGSWTFQPIAFTSAPVEWTGANWPGVVELWQRRLILAATPGERNRLLASRAGSPFDFTLETPVTGGDPVVTPSDGIDLKVSTKGVIRWVQGGRALLAGTDCGEHSFSSSSGALAPTDVHLRDESAFGSAAMQAVHAGSMVLYASGDRRKVRALAYDLQSSGWDSKDPTFLARHLTAGKVKELHRAREPNGSIVVLLETGQAALATFDPGEGVAAWWRLDAGDIKSVVVADGPDGSWLWLLVHRGEQLLLEQLDLAELDGAVYLDSSITVELEEDQVVVEGLDHLEGETVGIVLDGRVCPQQEVEDGTVTLQETGATVTVGLPFTARAVTLRPEGGNPAGTAQGQKKRRTKIIARLNESAMPIINGERPEEPQPGEAALVSEDVEVCSADWEEDGQITIEQDLPLRTEVLALFGNVQVNGV